MTPCQNDQLIQAHEDRILRMEQATNQVSTQIAEQGIKVGYMTQQIAEIRKDLTEKMDAVVESVNNKLDDTIASIHKITDKVQDQDKRIEHLETSEHGRRKRIATIRKVIISAMTVGLGALVTKLIENWK